LEQVESFAQKCLEEKGTRFVFCSDEFYVVAEKPIPDYEFYEDFAQIENGVGLLAKFKQEFDEGVQVFSRAKNKKFTIATGDSAFGFISSLANELKQKFDVKVDVVEIKNKFFGESVTVSGLLTAPDILDTLEQSGVGDVLLLPRSLLRETEDVFLDGMTLDQFKIKVGKEVKIVENDGFDFCAHMLEGDF
jgi:NifB/MoaA-like Fe-S oxidoreductase